jgi:hypothetical protein
LIPDYENPPEFSLIEITDGKAYETPNLKSTGFTINQENDSPLKLEISLETISKKTEIIKPEIEIPESTKFFYLPKSMKIQANLKNEPIFRIDTLTSVTEKPLIIEAFSRKEYEANHYGKFAIQIEDYQFEKMLNSNGYYSNQCYGNAIFYIYIRE